MYVCVCGMCVGVCVSVCLSAIAFLCFSSLKEAEIYQGQDETSGDSAFHVLKGNKISLLRLSHLPVAASPCTAYYCQRLKYQPSLFYWFIFLSNSLLFGLYSAISFFTCCASNCDIFSGPSALHPQVTVTVHVDAASARMVGLGSCANSPGHVT